MSDNKETKQAPAVEAGVRDELTQFEEWVTTKWRPDDGAKLLKREFPSFAFAAWQARAALAHASGAENKLGRDAQQICDWLLTDPQTGENLRFAGPLEPDFLRFSHVKMQSESGAVWTLSARLEEGYLTASERMENIKRVASEEKAEGDSTRASEAAGEPIGWFQLKPEFGSDRIGIRWNGDGRLNDGQALYAVPQPASEQQATHVSVPRELFQDLVEEVSDYAASRKFRKSEIEWRKERIEAAWAILAAKGDGHV